MGGGAVMVVEGEAESPPDSPPAESRWATACVKPLCLCFLWRFCVWPRRADFVWCGAIWVRLCRAGWMAVPPNLGSCCWPTGREQPVSGSE